MTNEIRDEASAPTTKATHAAESTLYEAADMLLLELDATDHGNEGAADCPICQATDKFRKVFYASKPPESPAPQSTVAPSGVSPDEDDEYVLTDLGQAIVAHGRPRDTQQTLLPAASVGQPTHATGASVSGLRSLAEVFAYEIDRDVLDENVWASRMRQGRANESTFTASEVSTLTAYLTEKTAQQTPLPAERDTARLDWLERNAAVYLGGYAATYTWQEVDREWLKNAEMREAIDAAIASQAGEREP